MSRTVYMSKRSGKPGSKPVSGRDRNRMVVVNSPSKFTRGGRGTDVYVGNLAWDVDWKDLKTCMREAGEVVRADVMVHESGRSKGYGIVEFATKAGAENAIETLNGIMVKGREIYVREERDGKGGRTDATADGIVDNSRVYVGNLSFDVSWQELKDIMRQAGSVIRVDILIDRNGRSRGCGIVQYATTAEANHAIATLQQTEIMGRKIFIREDREPPTSGGVEYQPKELPPDAVNRVYMGNLNFDIAWQDLKDYVREQGFDVVNVDLLTNKKGRSLGCAVVEFVDAETAQRAIEVLNNSEIMGREVYVREDREDRFTG